MRCSQVCHWCHCVSLMPPCHDVTVIDATVDHWCHQCLCVIDVTMSLWITDVTVSLMSLVSLCVTDVTMSLMLLCHWCHCITDVTMSAAPYKSLFCSYHILMSSVIYLSDEGLTLETSALKLFTWPIYVINSVDDPKLPYYTLPLTQHHSFFRNVPPLLLNSCTATCNRFVTCNMEMKQFFPFI